MPLHMDPGVLSFLGGAGSMGRPGPPVGDVDSRRRNMSEAFAALAASRDPVPGVDRTDVSTAAGDGTELKMAWYTKAMAAPPGSAVLYLHGGAFIVSLLPVYDTIIREYTEAT